MLYIEHTKHFKSLSGFLCRLNDSVRIKSFYFVCKTYSLSMKLLMATWVLTDRHFPSMGRSILNGSRYITLTFYRYTDGR